MSRQGYLICGKTDCGKKGSIRKRYRDHVQIPQSKKIERITEALEYNAKNFYKQHEHFTYLPVDLEQEKRFILDEYYKILPFTPHNREDVIDFEKKWIEILSKDSKLRYPIKIPKVSNSLTLPREFNNNNIYKISKEFLRKETYPRPNRLSIFCLFCSVSFASLLEVFNELEQESYPELFSSGSVLDCEYCCQCLVKCIILPYSYIEIIFNEKYHISEFNILKLIKDSHEHSIRGASTRNSKNWLICIKCLENRHLSWIEKEKCLKCGSPKKITRLDPKIVERIYCNAVNDTRFLVVHYLLLVKFWSKLTNLLKNDSKIREKYISAFKKYENEILNPKSTYLKNHDYLMIHYDPIKSSKKTSHSLSELEMLNTRVIDNEYLLGLTFFSLRGPGPFINRIANLLSDYGFPDEIVLTKLSADFLQSNFAINHDNY